jgi:hypothetical protein
MIIAYARDRTQEFMAVARIAVVMKTQDKDEINVH